MPTIGAGTALRFNNYQGFQRSYSLTTGFKGYGSLSMNMTAAGVTFSAQLNPLKLLNSGAKKQKKLAAREKTLKTESAKKRGDRDIEVKHRMGSLGERTAGSLLGGAGSAYGLFSFSEAVTAPTLSEYRGYCLNLSFGGEINPAQAPVGVEGGYSGSFSLQHNISVTSVNAYGYMHNPSIKGIGISDYYVEKAQPFDKRDYFMGIPFSNPDNFTLSGEGLGGGFRMYRPDVGHHYPNFVESDMQIYEVGFEGMIGVNVGMGLSFGFGNQKSKLKDWANTGNASGYQFTGGAPVFRFNGDLGGKIEYASNDLYTAKVKASPHFPGITSGYIDFDGDLYNFINDASNSANADLAAKRSSYIDPRITSGEIDGFEIFNGFPQRSTTA